MQLTETEARRKEFTRKKNRMAYCSFQMLKMITFIICNLPQPSCSHQVVDEKNNNKFMKLFIVLSVPVTK